VTAPSADTWRPYAATKARGGRWSGSTAWKYPPQQRSEIAPKVQPTVQTAVVAASTSDRRWAEKWVTPGDQPAFEAAIKTSMTGGEGRWTTDNGMFGTAFPAARVGKCATIELMISPAQGGLPILNRGSIVQCT
jgi:hypothetical protein